MDLALFSESHEAFVKETQVHTQGLSRVIVPTQEMRAAQLLLSMHRAKGTNTLFVGQAGTGKTLFFEWMRSWTRIPDQKVSLTVQILVV